MTYENILINADNSVTTITINRPIQNALNRATIEELHLFLRLSQKTNKHE
jgi:enoyl-CoA hydratase/carnithine racemase